MAPQGIARATSRKAVAMSEQVDAAVRDRMSRGIELLHQETCKLMEESGDAPAPGSKAEGELANAPGESRPWSVYTQAGLLIDVTADQMSAFVATIQHPFHTIAPLTCVRSSME